MNVRTIMPLPVVLALGVLTVPSGADNRNTCELAFEPVHQVFELDGSYRAIDQSVVFTLVNRGSKRGTITRLDTSCGCMVAESVAGRTLRPGESVELTAVARVSNFQTKTVKIAAHFGEKMAQATVDFRVPPSPTKLPVFKHIPDFLRYESVGESWRGSFNIVTLEHAGAAHWITGIQGRPQGIRGTISEVVEEPSDDGLARRREYKIILAGQGPHSSGGVGLYSLMIMTSEADSEIRAITVRVDSRQELRCVPTALYYASVSSTPSTRHVIIVDESEAADSIDWKPPSETWLRVAKVNDASNIGGRHRFEIAIDEAQVADAFAANGQNVLESFVEFHTSEKVPRTVKLPLLVRRNAK